MTSSSLTSASSDFGSSKPPQPGCPTDAEWDAANLVITVSGLADYGPYHFSLLNGTYHVSGHWFRSTILGTFLATNVPNGPPMEGMLWLFLGLFCHYQDGISWWDIGLGFGMVGQGGVNLAYVTGPQPGGILNGSFAFPPGWYGSPVLSISLEPES